MKKLGSNLFLIFSFSANLASIIGIILIAFNNAINVIIALSFFILCILCMLITVIWGIYSFVKKENERDHQKVSIFSKFECIDGVKGIFETYRVIQSKRLVLNKIEHGFKWSGKMMPRISSNLQDIKNLRIVDNGYDKVNLIFKRPLLFNETAAVHFKAETDDVDGSAKPYLDCRVDTYLNIIQFRVILKYKDDSFNKPAKVMRKPIDSIISSDYRVFESVPFDEVTKSYEYNLINPEPGYFYRIMWEK